MKFNQIIKEFIMKIVSLKTIFMEKWFKIKNSNLCLKSVMKRIDKVIIKKIKKNSIDLIKKNLIEMIITTH